MLSTLQLNNNNLLPPDHKLYHFLPIPYNAQSPFSIPYQLFFHKPNQDTRPQGGFSFATFLRTALVVVVSPATAAASPAFVAVNVQ
jgi:hypothetical protein